MGPFSIAGFSTEYATEMTGAYAIRLKDGHRICFDKSHVTLSHSATSAALVYAYDGVDKFRAYDHGDIEVYGEILAGALQSSASYANDAAAATGGVRVKELYRNGSAVQIRVA